MSNLITFENVSKSFSLHHQKTLKELLQALVVGRKTVETVQALQDINFSIAKGETVGVIGKNGAGKSTMLKLLAGVSQPTEGTLSVNGKTAPLIELGAGFHPELTGMENIFLNGVILGMTEKHIQEHLADIISFSGLEAKFIEMPVKYYSSGMYMRLAFSVAIFTKPDILLVDEILAVGDAGFQKKCFDKMKEFQERGVTIVLVSHSLNQVKTMCDRTLYLKEGRLVFDGDTTKALEIYEQDT